MDVARGSGRDFNEAAREKNMWRRWNTKDHESKACSVFVCICVCKTIIGKHCYQTLKKKKVYICYVGSLQNNTRDPSGFVSNCFASSRSCVIMMNVFVLNITNTDLHINTMLLIYTALG